MHLYDIDNDMLNTESLHDRRVRHVLVVRMFRSVALRVDHYAHRGDSITKQILEVPLPYAIVDTFV